MSIHLRFGTAKNGWLPAELEIDDGRYRFAVSYIPKDFILDLVSALSQTLSQEGAFVATVNEEPTESDWTFYRIQDAVAFSIIEHPDMRRHRGSGKRVVETSGGVLEIVLPFWRGLRELESRKLNEHFKAHWHQAFPTAELEKLTRQIERHKHAAA